MKMKKIKMNLVAVQVLFLLLLGVVILPNALAMEHGKDHDSGNVLPSPLAIPADMSCGVCGMYPARYEQWQTQMIFSNGDMVPFDGCKDMFKYLLNMKEYSNTHTRQDLAVAWVKDFNTGKWINAKDAYFVVASSEMGPMGKELIPFGSMTAAQEFKQNKGGMLKHFHEINMEVVEKLGMGGMKHHMMKKETMENHEHHMEKEHMEHGKGHM